MSLVDGRRVTLGPYPTREEAERMRDAHLVELADAKVAPVGGLTLRAYGAKWLDHRELRGLRSVDTDRYRWKHVLASDLADRPLASISDVDAQLFIDGLVSMSANSRIRVRALANRLYRDAVKRGLVPRNPFAHVDVARDPLAQDPWTYLPPEEQSALLGCEQIPEADRLVVQFALGTGLRQGEQWNLRLCDVSLELGDEHVMVRFGSKNKPPKNGKVRRVELFGLGLDAARRWMQLLPAYAPSNPLGLVFPTARGCRRTREPRMWRQHLRAAGPGDPSRRHDGRPVRWHDLRHSCASSLVAGWWGQRWSLHEVSRLLGHSSVKVTERYAHLADTVIQERARETTARLVLVRAKGPSAASSPSTFPVPRGSRIGHDWSRLALGRAKLSNDSRRARSDSNGRPLDSKSRALSS